MAGLGWVKAELPVEVYERLSAFAASVPAEWTCDNQGLKPSEGGKTEQHFHITFLLQLSNPPAKLDALRAILKETEPIELGFGELAYQPVGRITRRKVNCMFLPVLDDSGRLRQLRERCAAVIGGKVGYEGPGHISLVYVVDKHIKTGDALAQEHRGLMSGVKFMLRSVVVEWGPRNAINKDRAEVFFKGCEPTA